MATLAERQPVDRLVEAVGADALAMDAPTLTIVGQDVFSKGAPPAALFRPTDIAMLQRGIAVAADSGMAIMPRGGGMSYTSGYLDDRPGALVVDMGGLNRIVSVDEAAMTVTVEAGCTWKALYDTLHPRGLRAPVWGPLSGINATIGGGASQNGLFWGASRGSIAASVLAFDVVLADGRLARTGSDVLRPFGPDITGLFAADCGALGIKARIVLPLIREAATLSYGSFAFETPAAVTAAMSAIAREGLASECFGFDPFLQAQRMKRESLTRDAQMLVATMRAQGGFWKGVREGAKIVAAGRSFLADARFVIHCIAEGRGQAAADADMAAIRRIATELGGREVDNSVPKILRANPFPPVNSMLGPNGERWVPIHGVVGHSRALATIEAITALFEVHAPAMERLGVGAGYMFVTVATTGCLIEPVFFWPDAQDALHKASVEPAHLTRLRDFPPNPEARALVEHLRGDVIAIFTRMEAVHFQIGRAYPFAERSDPTAWALLRAAKAILDPRGVMNPGVLGL